MMPGAARLLGHLRGAGVPLAVATSTPRRTYEAKMSGPSGAGVAQLFGACTCGDEVRPMY
jgi:riboflavin kinase / FMN hydrolase